MGWSWWLRTSWTHTILLLGELDNAVQDIQQTFPGGEMVCVRGPLVHALGPQRQLAELCPPSHCFLGCGSSLTLHQVVLAMMTHPIGAARMGNYYQPMGF